MRALVVHNPGAGADDATHAELHHALIAAGHEVVYADVAAVASFPSTASEARADLVVVAGGDGTVGAAFCALAGADVAVAVVPLGTANNIASSLGLAGLTPADLVAGWDPAHDVRFDLLSIEIDGRVRCAAESFGGGMIAALITGGDELDLGLDVDTARDALRRLVPRWAPEHWSLEIDGVDFSGAYLAVHAMNITSIGPNVALVPDARVDDGAIDVVMIGAVDRDVLLDHLQSPDHEWWRGLGLRTVRAREVKAVVAAAEPLVVDDAAVVPDATADRRVHVRVADAGLRLRMPAQAAQGRAVASASAADAATSIRTESHTTCPRSA